MANFIPPVNGASQGNYFLAKMAVFRAKMCKQIMYLLLSKQIRHIGNCLDNAARVL